MLDDTGWYDVDCSGLERSAWGDGASLGQSPLRTFATEAPALVFPRHYLCESWQFRSDVCSYDFTGVALCRGQVVNCTVPSGEDDLKFCMMVNFSDPLATSEMHLRGTSEVHDFMMYRAPYSNGRCSDLANNNDAARRNGEIYGGESLCLMSTLSRSSFAPYSQQHGACHRVICNHNGTFSVFVDAMESVCRAAGERLVFDGFSGDLECQEPRQLCAIRTFYGLLGPTAAPTPKSEFGSLGKLEVWHVVILTIGTAFVAVIVTLAVLQRCRRKQVEGEMEKVKVINEEGPRGVL
jgi:hypothetical protein